MGTRSLTFVYDGEEAIINMYRQYDGYPTGHGAELAEFLSGFEAITNGLRVGDTRRVANGMGCLAAQLVSNFKGNEAGQFYLYPTSALECGQDYEYHVYQKNNELRVGITNRGCNFFGLSNSDINEKIFDGTVAELVEFVLKRKKHNAIMAGSGMGWGQPHLCDRSGQHSLGSRSPAGRPIWQR